MSVASAGAREDGASDGEVEDDRLREVRVDDRADPVAVGAQPGLDRGRLRAGDEAAGVAQPVVRQARRDRAHRLERLPGGCFADEEVVVVRLRGAAVRRETDARAQADGREDPERLDLGLGERALGVVAGRDRGRGRDRVGLPEERVGDGDGGLGDGPAFDHVAEVEEPGDGPSFGRGIADAGRCGRWRRCG